MTPANLSAVPSLPDWAARTMAPYRLARHHHLILERLEALAEGHCDRLMLLMPPGSAKSTYASVAFPSWYMLRKPQARVVAACHTESLAAHFGRRVRATIRDYGESTEDGLARDDRSAVRFSTFAGASYFATGVRGPLMGRRADLIVIDDPIKTAAEAESTQCRDALWDWYRTELTTRLTPGGKIVLVMARWHEDDLAARLLAGGDNWQTLRLPALADKPDDPLGRMPGEPLWPEWEDIAALARRRQAVGSRVWAAQYQQAPRADLEALFQCSRIGVLETAPPCQRVVRAWDLAATAASEGRDPDWTAGIKLGRTEAGGFVVLDVCRFRGGPGEVSEAITQTARMDGRDVTIGLPQDPGQAGKQQVVWLTGLLPGYRVEAGPETGSKVTRAGPAAAQVEAGNFAIVRAPWNSAFLNELREFPGGRKDDQVDALARALAIHAEAPTATRRMNVPIMGR